MKHFKLDEFKCPCCGENKISPKLLERLERARVYADVPFIINSGYRCEKHNKEIGGSPTSSHKKGLACDIKITSSSNRFDILTALLDSGFKRIGIYKNFIHCDIDAIKSQQVVWYA